MTAPALATRNKRPSTRDLGAPSLSRFVAPIVVLVVVLGLWEGGAFHTLFNIKEFTLSYPSQILNALIRNQDQLMRHTTTTLTEAVVGYVIGSSLGFVVAVAFAGFPTLRSTVLPLMNGLNSMPIVALAPLMTVYLGSGMDSKIAVVTLMTTAPMAVTAFKGLTSIDAASEDLMRAMAATRGEEFRKLRLPSSLPFVFTALKLNVTLALIGAIIAEFFSAMSGLGFAMSRALVSFDLPLAWATMTLAGLAGVLFYLVVTLVERLAIPWHASLRQV